MNSLIIIVPKNFDFMKLFCSFNKENLTNNKYNEIIIENKQKHIFVNKDNNLINDYENYELNNILKENREVDFYLFEYNDFKFAKQILLEMKLTAEIIIDDDHNNFYSGDDFLIRLQNENFNWQK